MYFPYLTKNINSINSPSAHISPGRCFPCKNPPLEFLGYESSALRAFLAASLNLSSPVFVYSQIRIDAGIISSRQSPTNLEIVPSSPT